MTALLPSFAGYRSEWLKGDLSAGLTVWAVLIPEALAYAAIAGVSPVVGLYAAPPALLLYALFGSSRQLIVGPMSATAALSAAVVADAVGASGGDFTALTAAVAIAVGVVGIMAVLLRFGFIANLISEPVLKGFIIGLALTIIVGQLPALFGVQGGSGDFFEKLWHLLGQLDDTDAWSLAVGASSLALVLGLKRSHPEVPASLVAVLLGIIASNLLDLSGKGVAIVGPIDGGLPSFGIPNGISLHEIVKLLPGSIGILLVGFVEGLGAAKTYAARDNYEIDANRELLGLAAANLAAGLSSGMVVNGSLSKTAVNGSAGAKSQTSGLVVAALTVVTLLFLTSLFEKLPEPTLAAVVIAAVIELVDLQALRRLYALRTRDVAGISRTVGMADFLGALAALFGVLIFDTLPGLFIGASISVLLILLRVSTPRVAVLGRVPGSDQFSDIARTPEDEAVPGVLVLRPEAVLFFANAEHVEHEVRRLAHQSEAHAVVLDLEAVPFVDATSAATLVSLSSALEHDGRRFVLAHSLAPVRQFLTQASNGANLQTFPTIAAAVRELTSPARKPVELRPPPRP